MDKYSNNSTAQMDSCGVNGVTATKNHTAQFLVVEYLSKWGGETCIPYPAVSAVQDVQHALNAIRALSADENAQVQQQILELMLQASISQLKSLGAETSTKNRAKQPNKPAPLPIPKPAKPTAANPKPKPKPEPSLNTRLNRLRAVKPQAPRS